MFQLILARLTDTFHYINALQIAWNGIDRYVDDVDVMLKGLDPGVR